MVCHLHTLIGFLGIDYVYELWKRFKEAKKFVGNVGEPALLQQDLLEKVVLCLKNISFYRLYMNIQI